MRFSLFTKHAVIRLFVVTISSVFIGGCIAYPNRLESKTVSQTALTGIVEHTPQYEWAYAGSDVYFHYFMRWRYGAWLFPMPKRTLYAAYKLPRNQMKISREMPLTSDVSKWRSCFHRQAPYGGVFTTRETP